MQVGHVVEYEPLPVSCKGCFNRRKYEGREGYHCSIAPGGYYGTGLERQRVEEIAPAVWERCPGYGYFVVVKLVRDHSRKVILQRVSIIPVDTKTGQAISSDTS